MLIFEKPFQVQMNASTIKIGATLTQDGKPVAFFSEKFSLTLQRWTIYEQNLYAASELLSNGNINSFI